MALVVARPVWSLRGFLPRFTDTVLNVLGLAHVEGVVGDDINRGMSGGERKRVNIGVELAAAPLLLCLVRHLAACVATARHQLSAVCMAGCGRRTRQHRVSTQPLH